MFREERLDMVIDELGVPGRFLGPIVKGIRVKVSYSGQQKNKTIVGLAPPHDRTMPPTADNVLITCPQHGRETVAQHFQGAWPNVWRPNGGAYVVDFGNQVYIPSDLCELLPGNAYRGLLSGDQTTNMINFACRKPKQNRDLILKEGLKLLRFGEDDGPTERFGIALADMQPRMMQVTARLLPAPNITFAGGTTEKFSSGAWNLKGKKFAMPATDLWTKVTYLDLRRPGTKPCQNVNDLIKGINDGIKRYLGSNSKVLTFKDFVHARELPRAISPNNLAKALGSTFSVLLEKDIRLVLIILPDKSQDTYYAVKKAGDLTAGVHTICTVRDEKDNVKSDMGFIANLMLKFNQKLGGVNFELQPLAGYDNLVGGKNSNTMIVGADVVSRGSMRCRFDVLNLYRLILEPVQWWAPLRSRLWLLLSTKPSSTTRVAFDYSQPRTKTRKPSR